MMKVKDALKKGYIETEISIKVLMHPETGNILYPCDKLHGKDKVAFDRYSIISDPVTEDAEEEGKAVNLVLNQTRNQAGAEYYGGYYGYAAGERASQDSQQE